MVRKVAMSDFDGDEERTRSDALSAANGAEPVTWLDLLPAQVCAYVMSNLIKGSDISNAVGLCLTSDIQKTAMRQALSYTLDAQELYFHSEPFRWRKGAFDFVSDLLQDTARKIHAGSNFTDNEYVRKCCRSKTLVSASFSRGGFELLEHAKRLRSLHLVDIKFDEETKPSLARLSALDIRDFSLTCGRESCLHKLFLVDPIERGSLASWFPRVEKLRLSCWCTARSLAADDSWKPDLYIWHAIDPFTKLREVTMTEEVPQEAISRLRQMDCINLDSTSTLYLIEQIPDHICAVTVTKVECFRPDNMSSAVPRSLLESFRLCGSLASLECCLTRGVENALVRLPGNVRCLRVTFADYGQVREEQVFSKLYQPESGVLLAVVKSHPLLRCVVFNQAVTDASEIREMLMTLGKRVEEFSAQMITRIYEDKAKSNKSDLEEFVATLVTAGLYNPSLKRFKIHCGGECFSDNDAISSLLPNLRAARRVLQRRAPLLITGHC